jgi:predicted nuclease with TOPRIM domain
MIFSKDKIKQYKPHGIDLIDNLTPQERKELKAKLQQHFDSLSQDEKIEHMNLMHDLIREKLRQHGGMISKQDAINQYHNEHFPIIIKEGLQYIEARARTIKDLKLVQDLKKAEWRTKHFDFDIIEDDEGFSVSLKE